MTDLANLLRTLHTVRQQRTALEKTEKVVLAELKPLVDSKFDELPDQPVVGDGLALTRTSGASRTISGDLLLERGVAPDIVAYATKTTTYYQYRTKEQKS